MSFYIRGPFQGSGGTKGRKRVSIGLKASIKSVLIAEKRFLDVLNEMNKNGSIPETLT